MTFELAEFQFRCPSCGRFTDDEGYGDVEPGGCRGVDYVAIYCNEACAEKTYAEHHKSIADDCVCEV